MTNRIERYYSELIKLPTFEERFNYLKVPGIVGNDTFGYDRWLNQQFYLSAIWKKVRRDIILRDNGNDLGLEGYPIFGSIYIHHLIPITKEDILNNSSILTNPEYLICMSFKTHNALHYGSESPEIKIVERQANDTCPWRK